MGGPNVFGANRLTSASFPKSQRLNPTTPRPGIPVAGPPTADTPPAPDTGLIAPILSPEDQAAMTAEFTNRGIDPTGPLAGVLSTQYTSGTLSPNLMPKMVTPAPTTVPNQTFNATSPTPISTPAKTPTKTTEPVEKRQKYGMF